MRRFFPRRRRARRPARARARATALGGVVAASVGCAVVEPWVGIVAGVVAALVVPGTRYLVEKIFHVDDVCNVVAVHGGAAFWGAIWCVRQATRPAG